MSTTFLLPQLSYQTPTKAPVQAAYVQFIKPITEPKFPESTQAEIDHSVAIVEAARQEAARQAALEAAEAAAAAQAAIHTAPTITIISSPSNGILVAGSMGYSLAGGNCVDEPGVNNPGWGNPIDWPVLYASPHVGATVLFTWNHTGVVAGIYSDGSIEVRQRNAGGASHHVSLGEIRGYR